VNKVNATIWKQALLPQGLTIPFVDPSPPLLDESTGALLLAVNHGFSSKPNPSPHHGDVYLSNTDGSRFVLELEHVVNYHNWWDFHTVDAIPGVYIANTLANWEDDREDTFQSYFQGNLRTYLTFDNARSWSRLTPPSIECTGVVGPCYLNLFGRTTWLGFGSSSRGGNYYGDVYSVSQAVGLIIGTGNVGTYLTFAPETVNTYLSRDGVWSWEKLINGSTLQEYLDSGGLLVVAKNQVPTQTLYYSFDEGRTLNEYSFTNQNIIIFFLFTLDNTGKKSDHSRTSNWSTCWKIYLNQC